MTTTWNTKAGGIFNMADKRKMSQSSQEVRQLGRGALKIGSSVAVCLFISCGLLCRLPLGHIALPCLAYLPLGCWLSTLPSSLFLILRQNSAVCPQNITIAMEAPVLLIQIWMTLHHIKNIKTSVFFLLLLCTLTQHIDVNNLLSPSLNPSHFHCLSFWQYPWALPWCKNLPLFCCWWLGANFCFKPCHHLLFMGWRAFLFANESCSEQSSASSVHQNCLVNWNWAWSADDHCQTNTSILFK